MALFNDNADSRILLEDLNVRKSPLLDYLEAFLSEPDFLFLSFISICEDKTLRNETWTRKEFLDLSLKCVSLLDHFHESSQTSSSSFVHFFTGNSYLDLALRLAAIFLNLIPVTINWQADTVDRVKYKIEATGSFLVVVDSGVSEEMIESIQLSFPSLVCFVF